MPRIGSVHECCKRGDSAGVSRCLADEPAQLELERASGFTPLMVAAWYGHDDVVSVLLQSGADANRRLATASYSKGVTPLYMAARNGWPKTVMLLLGARADPELARVADESTPLATAAKHGRAEVIQVLLRAGAAIDAVDGGDSTPLLLAAKHGHPAAVELLLQAGAEPNGSTAWRPNALVVAAHQDDVPVIDAFLRVKPACVNMTLPNGATGLHMAAACGNVAATTRLLDAGANPERCRSDGQTAVSLASANGYDDVREVIVQSLASVEGRRPAVSRIQRLKRLQQSARVMQGAKPLSGPTKTPEEPPGQGEGARGGGQLGTEVDQRSPSRPSTPSSAASSDSGAAGATLPAWSKLRLVRRLAVAERSPAGDGSDDEFATMKQEIVDAVGMLSKRGYQSVMDLLNGDGDGDGEKSEDGSATFELDNLSPDLLKSLHAFVTDSTNHSKRHRSKHPQHHRHASESDQDPEQHSQGGTADRHRHHRHHHHHHHSSGGSEQKRDQDETVEAVIIGSADTNTNDTRYSPITKEGKGDVDADSSSNAASADEWVRLPAIKTSTSSADTPFLVNDDSDVDANVEQQPQPDARPAASAVLPDLPNLPNLPEIENVSGEYAAGSSEVASRHSSARTNTSDRGSGNESEVQRGPSAQVRPGTPAAARRGSASSLASESTVVSAQTDSDDERLVAAQRG
jgi:ankyrin repeat protein